MADNADDQSSNESVDALEQEESTSSSDDNSSAQSAAPRLTKQTKSNLFHRLIGHFNIYLLLFVLIVVIVTAITYVSYIRQQNNINPKDIPSQQLDESAFGQLQSGDASVGDPKQTLTVQSNAIFSGQILAKNDIEIAGTLKVGGTLNLTGLIVDGNSTLDQIQANTLSLNGESNLQGQLNVGSNLSVTGSGSFGGEISAPLVATDSLQLSGDLTFTRHIDAGGPTPEQSSGTALGGGGTVSVSGTDTAGSIAVNTGSNAGAGCFVTLTFANKFRETPHVVVTPIGANAAALSFYVTRDINKFSVCTANNPPSSSNFGFDYIVID